LLGLVQVFVMGHAQAQAQAPAQAQAQQPAASSKAQVSMSELRDLIDKKITEVRNNQAPAPVVRVRTRGRAVPTPPKEVIQWDYSGEGGPEHWGRLEPANHLCAKGLRQSPIEVGGGIRVDLEPIGFDYRNTDFRVIDTGHTVEVRVEPGSSITVSQRRYELKQFHFHRPSEERVNGRHHDMSLHLVHADEQGRLAVVAVLMDQAKDHAAVQQIWNALPLEKHTEQVSAVPLDLNALLPEQRQYHTYMGSITTPPCTEGVLWLVMKQPVGVSPY